MADGSAAGLFDQFGTAAAKCERETLRRLAKEIGNKVQKDAANPAVQLDPVACLKTLEQLRRFRLFQDLAWLAGIMAGAGLRQIKIRRLQAQGLIDSDQISAAIDVLDKLEVEAKRELEQAPAGTAAYNAYAREHSEVLAILGRAYKQQYVNFGCRCATHSCTSLIEQSIAKYNAAFKAAPHPERDYPGVNLLAMIARAKRDGIALSEPIEVEKVVEAVKADATLKMSAGDDPWAAASLAETCLYEGDHDRAALNFGLYAFHKYVDEFALSGTIRQLEEVWGLSAGVEGAEPIMASLKYRLFSLPGCSVEVSPEERAKLAGHKLSDMGELPAIFHSAQGSGNESARHAAVSGDLSAHLALQRQVLDESQIFRMTPQMKKIWDLLWQSGTSVARIVDNKTRVTYGTGFLVAGCELCDGLSSEVFLLTNSHVVATERRNEPGTFATALHPKNARIVFDFSSQPTAVEYSCEAVWESPPDQLDATLLRLTPAPNATPMKLAPAGFELCSEGRGGSGGPPNQVVIIGHMQGGTLTMAYESNGKGVLVDMGNKPPPPGDRFVYLHYRTRTEPGNSGSPVIDFDTVNVVGLHRAGPSVFKGQIPSLNGRPGTIDANEGVHIDSIRTHIAQSVASGHLKLAGCVATHAPAPVATAAAHQASLLAAEGAVISLAAAAAAIAVPRLAPVDGTTIARITFAQLMERLSNPETTKEDLAHYFLADPDNSNAYAPAFKVNPETVDLEGARETVSDFLKPANYICALRRRDACRQKIAAGYAGLRFVSEGDSWFEYPFLLDDVIDNLSRDFAVHCIAAAGDVLQNMASAANVERQILPAIEEVKAHGLLFSGGGNDIVGEVLLTCLGAHNNPKEPLRYLTQAFDTQLEAIRKLYQTAFDTLFRRNPGLKIFTHGYDLPTPKPNGKWLGKYFQQRNIADAELQRAIVKAMLGKVTAMHRQLEQIYEGRVYFVDCAGIVGDSAWYDELHPSNAGYARVADRFREAIERAFPKQRPRLH